MKITSSVRLPGISLLLLAMFVQFAAVSQSTLKDKKIIADAKKAKSEFINADESLNEIFDNAYGYVLFPNVGKGGFGIGGATGNGAVYENDVLIGMANMTQLTIGFQWGGQAYREVIFFETKEDLDKFKDDNFEFSAQASAVAAKAGASATASYNDGVLIFTQTKGGLMYEASVGGQKFKYRDL